jgi:hypothetical protein
VFFAVLHESLPSSFTLKLGFIRPSPGCFKQINLSARMHHVLFGIGVVAQCEDVEVQQAVLFLAIHNCGDHAPFGGGRLAPGREPFHAARLDVYFLEPGARMEVPAKMEIRAEGKTLKEEVCFT